jgi:hypothetical protein
MNVNTEKVQLQKIDNKKGIYMSKNRYDFIVEMILKILTQQQQTTLTELINESETYSDKIGNEIAWDMLQVKQDLEARGVIKIDYIANRVQLIILKKRIQQRSLAGNKLKGNYY